MPFTLIPQNSISGGVGDSLRPNAKPLIINGDMAVAQRGTSKTSITGGGYYTIDRFDVNNAGAFIGTWTQTQESLSSGDPFADGFAKSLKMDWHRGKKITIKIWRQITGRYGLWLILIGYQIDKTTKNRVGLQSHQARLIKRGCK